MHVGGERGRWVGRELKMFYDLESKLTTKARTIIIAKFYNSLRRKS